MTLREFAEKVGENLVVLLRSRNYHVERFDIVNEKKNNIELMGLMIDFGNNISGVVYVEGAYEGAGGESATLADVLKVAKKYSEAYCGSATRKDCVHRPGRCGYQEDRESPMNARVQGILC